MWMNKLWPWSRVLRDKLIVVQLVKEFSFYGTRCIPNLECTADLNMAVIFVCSTPPLSLGVGFYLQVTCSPVHTAETNSQELVNEHVKWSDERSYACSVYSKSMPLMFAVSWVKSELLQFHRAASGKHYGETRSASRKQNTQQTCEQSAVRILYCARTSASSWAAIRLGPACEMMVYLKFDWSTVHCCHLNILHHNP
jgi:hypothetical protein